MCVSRFRRRIDFFFGRVQPAELNVLKDGVVEEKGVLRDQSDLLPERILRQVSQVASVDPNSARCRIIES